MHTEIGAFEAKANLSKLLQDVKQGHSFTITVRGEPIADLVPTGTGAREDIEAGIEAMKQIRKIQNVSDETVTEWIAQESL
ncbi:MAG: type II toxin-antitoxin system Phd/YefM family antitoxin [Gammaproteobacteria bacterium]